jgi:peptidoglycan/LPS O-acetylase OafA/YrhL
MIPDPTGSTAVAAMAALASTATMALFGVDYYSLLYALIGALFALASAEQMGRVRAVAFVLLSTLAGAVIGNAVAGYVEHPTRVQLFAMCLVGGLVAQIVATGILKAGPDLMDWGIKEVKRIWSSRTGGGA